MTSNKRWNKFKKIPIMNSRTNEKKIEKLFLFSAILGTEGSFHTKQQNKKRVVFLSTFFSLYWTCISFCCWLCLIAFVHCRKNNGKRAATSTRELAKAEEKWRKLLSVVLNIFSSIDPCASFSTHNSHRKYTDWTKINIFQYCKTFFSLATRSALFRLLSVSCVWWCFSASRFPSTNIELSNNFSLINLHKIDAVLFHRKQHQSILHSQQSFFMQKEKK